MKKWLLFSFLVFVLGPFLRAEHPYQEYVAEEKVILRTEAGDILLSLYPKIAPGTVRQFRTLVDQGIYNGTHFYRVVPGFVLQVSDASGREPPLSIRERSYIRGMPLEVNNKVRHIKGVISMARKDKNRISSSFSFSILLGDAPHLDGKYTIFGHVELGHEVLEELAKVETDASNRPLKRLGIQWARLTHPRPTPEAYGLWPARPIKSPINLERIETEKKLFMVGMHLVLALALAIFVLVRGERKRLIQALSLIAVLISGFYILSVLLPLGQKHAWVSIVLFLGLLALFKLMSRFESPDK